MPAKKIGFLLSQLGINQLSYQLIDSSNRLLSQRDDIDPSIYWMNDGPRVIQPRFMTACAYEMFAYDGVSVATSVQTAARMLEWPGPNRHKWLYYYLFDLDWIRLQNKQYEQLKSVYLHPKIQLIARSQNHFDIIKSCWKEPVGIVEDCDLEKFVNLAFD